MNQGSALNRALLLYYNKVKLPAISILFFWPYALIPSFNHFTLLNEVKHFFL